RVLATLLRPNAGTATIAGHDIMREPDAVRHSIGFLAHTPGLYDDLTTRENLVFAAAMLGSPAADIDGALERVALNHVADERVRGFSAGMQRRLAIARLSLSRPRVLLLDEPYSNLDTAGTVLMNTLITDTVDAGGAALVVLHELAPSAGVIDRLASGHEEGPHGRASLEGRILQCRRPRHHDSRPVRIRARTGHTRAARRRCRRA